MQPDLLDSFWLSSLRPQLEQLLSDTIRQQERGKNSLIERLAQHMRRMRNFESERQWSEAALDAAQLGSTRSMLFSVSVDKLRFQAARGFISPPAIEEIPYASAAAFASAIASSEPVTALKTATELSEPIANIVDANAGETIVIYPIKVRQRVAAVLYAEQGDTAALDLITTFAAAALESHMAHQATTRSSNMVTIAPAAGTPFVTREDEEWHVRAQRFARVQTAEIRLYHSDAVKKGRADKDLYGALRIQIDQARKAYEERYLQGAPNMADYLHQELVRTLANGDVELLGPEYPLE